MKKKMKYPKWSKLMAVTVSTTLLISYTGVGTQALATQTSVSSEVVKTDSTTVKKFELYSNTALLDAYNTQFKLQNEKIQSMKNNGGSYPDTSLEKMIDGNLASHWETGKANDAAFTNDLTFSFEEKTMLDRVVYSPRKTGAAGKGFAQQFEIYATKNEGGAFELVATGEYKGSVSDSIEIQFEPTEFKELKFVFKKANEQWASASEFMFYKEDVVAKKMDTLFTDNSLSSVNSVYNTLEKLGALEQEIAGHPYELVYEQRIKDAENILAMKDIEAVQAKTKPFKLYGNAAYKEQFMVPLTNLKQISNNGRHYAQSVLNHAIDGDTSTYWETATSNSASFNNTIEVAFEEAVNIDRFVYGARPSDNKGFITNFELYVSPTTAGDTYQLVATGDHNKVSGLVEAKFNEVKAQRVKLVVKKSDQSWATLSELAFFKKDELFDQVDNIFTDGTKSTVKEQFNTVEKIEALDETAQSHLLYNDMQVDLALAKKIINGELMIGDTVITAEQVGDRRGYTSSNLKSNIGSNMQPTGLAALAGDVITVYVEPNGASQLPRLEFTQTEGSWSNWNRSVQLSAGKNIITVPTVTQDNNYRYDVMAGGAIYLTNPYTKEQQGGTPVIRIEGAQDIPLMTKNTNPVAFKEELALHKEKVDADKAVNPALADRKVLDIVEMVSDHIIYSGTTTAAYKAYITQEKNPKATVDGYDLWMHDIFEFHGIDDTNAKRQTAGIRENVRLMQPWGFMYAAGNHTGIQRNEEHLMFNDLSKTYAGWGLNHEIGHRIDIGVRLWGEVTNNMTSMGMSVKYNSIDQRIPYNNIYKYVITENKVNFETLGLADKLGAFWQLEMAHPGYWAELENLYRERNIQSGGDALKQQNMVKLSSDVLKKDVSSHFARHGFVVTDETRAYTAKYEKAANYWYLNNSVIQYEGNGFTDQVVTAVDVKLNATANSATLNFSIDEANNKHVLGYEILRDGQVVGFTAGTSFTDVGIDPAQNYTYEVIAYDKKLQKAQSATVQSFKPTIEGDSLIKLKLNQAFDVQDYVQAFTYNGTDISDEVEVKSSTVNLKKKGQYELQVAVTNEGITSTKRIKVEVVSDFEYVSDLAPKSHNIQWGGLRLDKDPEGNTIELLKNGVAKHYEKGIGAHANSQIVYNIEGKGYTQFESYIGIDQAMKGKNSSATFEVWIDDKQVFASGVFGSGTEQQLVNLPIDADAKTLKLVTTNANKNGNESDHTVWADAKLTKDDQEPEIEVTSQATKVGAPIDLDGGYTATDAEDGDLTAEVTIIGQQEIDFNRAGKYEISYTVKDSAGNETTKVRTIVVVDLQQFKHVSSYDWTSESHTYRETKKNKATSGNPLRLKANNGEIIWNEKGLGAHATSEIVYDLSDKNADYFTSFIGIDSHLANSKGSVEFQVFVDGEKRYDSGVMTSSMAQKFIEVDLTNAKELKLVATDGGNGDGADHATWADAKFHSAEQ